MINNDVNIQNIKAFEAIEQVREPEAPNEVNESHSPNQEELRRSRYKKIALIVASVTVIAIIGIAANYFMTDSSTTNSSTISSTASSASFRKKIDLGQVTALPPGVIRTDSHLIRSDSKYFPLRIACTKENIEFLKLFEENARLATPGEEAKIAEEAKALFQQAQSGTGSLYIPYHQNSYLYTGSINKGEAEGSGKLIKFDNTTKKIAFIYEGPFKKGLPHGSKGNFRTSGATYVGDFIQGLLVGSGHYETLDYSIEGTFRQNGQWSVPEQGKVFINNDQYSISFDHYGFPYKISQQLANGKTCNFDSYSQLDAACKAKYDLYLDENINKKIFNAGQLFDFHPAHKT